MRKRGPGWVYPQRKRCMRCRQCFAWTIVDGLYDSYRCAGKPEPMWRGAPVDAYDRVDLGARFNDPDDWPRQHYVPQADGGKRPKVAYVSESAAEYSARQNGKQAYVCEYCEAWHIGSPRR